MRGTMSEKKISIIVPVYKAEAYLKRCVDSLVNQTYKEIEIILVDDGSPDGCPALCDAYAKEDVRIRVVHKTNGGLVSAWQAGVRESSGEYLCFVDSDDWVETDMLEGMVPFLTAEADSAKESEGSRIKEIVCCNFVINRPSGETKHYHGLPPGVYEGEKLEGEIKDNLLGHENRRISMSRCMKLFSRSLIEDNMQYCNPQITMGEDVNITLPALLDCERVVIMKEALYYHYFYNDESMVHKYDAKLYEGIKTLYHTIQNIYKIKGRSNGAEQADKEYLYLLLLALKNEIRSGAPGYVKRVKAICLAEESRKLAEKNSPLTSEKQGLAADGKPEMEDKTNQLLYLVFRKPFAPIILGVRAVFLVHDGRKGGKH